MTKKPKKTSRGMVEKLREHLAWCCDTLEQSASIIESDIDPDDIDGECEGVRERVKEMRELIGATP